MVTTRRVTKAKELEAANALISPASPVQSDDRDDERGISDPMQISSPPPNDDRPDTGQVTPTSPKDDYVDEDEDVNENSNPNSPMHLDPPSDLNDLDTPTSPKGDSDTHEDIAPEGDLIIQFSDLITVRFSSSTFSQASTPLKATIEEQRSRHLPTAISMHKEMHEDDAYTLFRLLRLLHNCPDPGTAAEFRMFDIAGANLLAAVKDGAENLHQLAILVDKYQCQEALRMTFESLLSEFAFPSARDDMGLDQAVQLVTAVYLLNQPRYFQLFTKRLVTDYAVNWTKKGPNGLQKDFPPEIPTKQASLMKNEIYRQSNDANDALDMEIRGYSFGRCSKHVDNKCDDPRPKDLMIVRRITESINVPGKLFPANWCNRVTLRYIMPRLYRLERVQRWLWCDHHREQTLDSVGPEQFTQLCMRVDREVLTGLCLGCTKADKVCGCEAGSVPHAGALRFVDQDSFLFPTSWLGTIDQRGGYR